MNIHFTDEILLKDLNEQTVATVRVGSHMYGLDTPTSDTDYLSIYIEPERNRNSFMWEHHQLQYKNNNIDYNFSSLQTFIRNALTGDATINFEVLWSDGLIDTEIEWLTEYRNDFINYNIIKSYLGLAKRDLKYWKRDTNNGKKHTAETHKKLSHFVRGVIFAKMLIKGYFKLDLDEHRTFTEWDYTDLELLDRLKHGTMDYSFSKLIDIVEKQMHFSRVENNTNSDKGLIKSFMNPETLKEIDNKIGETIREFDKDSDIFKVNYDRMYYDTLEHGVQY